MLRYMVIEFWYKIPKKSPFESEDGYKKKVSILVDLNKEWQAKLNDKDYFLFITAPSVVDKWKQIQQCFPKEALVYESPLTPNNNYPEDPKRLQMFIYFFGKTGVPNVVDRC